MFADEFIDTRFAHNVVSRYNSTDATDATHRRIGSDGCDVRVILNGWDILVHGAVLGQSFVLFHEMIFASSVGDDGFITLDGSFIFPEVLEVLIQFCYLMTASSFSLDKLLGTKLLNCFGEQLCQVHLFSVLAFLGESQLRDRVRFSLAATQAPPPPPEPMPRWIDEILMFYSIYDPFWFRNARNRVHHEFRELLSNWSNPRTPGPFVNPFTWIAAPNPPPPTAGSPSPVSFGDIADLAMFFRECSTIVDWTRGLFPPRPGNSFSDWSDVKAFVIQPWYSAAYCWAIPDDQGCQRPALVIGSPGIGKSVFGLYLLARLMASHRTTMFGHPFFLIGWFLSGSRRKQIRIYFSGNVEVVGQDQFCAGSFRGVFAILDGMAEHKDISFHHHVSIIAPSQCVNRPVADLHHYAPPITELQLELLSGLSKRYPLRDVDAEDLTALSTHGSIQSRMKITGGNLRLLFCDYSLAQLEHYFLRAARAIKFTPTLRQYFTGTLKKNDKPYHTAFSYFPKEGKIGYVSKFVEKILGEIVPDEKDVHSRDKNP
jgi:hypothetical protein